MFLPLCIHNIQITDWILSIPRMSICQKKVRSQIYKSRRFSEHPGNLVCIFLLRLQVRLWHLCQTDFRMKRENCFSHRKINIIKHEMKVIQNYAIQLYLFWWMFNVLHLSARTHIYFIHWNADFFLRLSFFYGDY